MPRPLKLLCAALVALALLAVVSLQRAPLPAEEHTLAESPPMASNGDADIDAATGGPFPPPPTRLDSSADEIALTAAIIRERPAPETSSPHQTRSDLPASERVYLAANERVQIPLSPAARAARQPITLRADHGGLLNDRALTPQVALPASAASFTFQAGASRGLYHVTVQQGPRVEILEFWVGEPSPPGAPGPARVILPPVATASNF